MKILDLTQNMNENTQVFPGSPSLKILKWSNYEMHEYDSEMIFTSTHLGTHIDSPIHFNPTGESVEKIPLEKTVILDKTKVLKIIKNDDETIDVNEVKKYNIKKDDTVLIYTGWSSNILKDKYFKKNPGLSEQAAEHLANLGINLVGIDSPNIDPAFDKKFKSHKIFSAKSIPIIENLVNLDRIHKDNFIFIALPLKLENCSGSPIRAIALIN
ncbi:MAG: cyclase family protein [Nitrosopumilus sp.]|nr:cyclase family protein [Nitrosopumilus sp.]